MADTLPPLPATAVDFDALHSALQSGKSVDDALVAAGAKLAEPELPADSDLTVPDGFTVVDRGGGWYEISGPDGFEPVKAHGRDDLEQKLEALSAPLDPFNNTDDEGAE